VSTAVNRDLELLAVWDGRVKGWSDGWTWGEVMQVDDWMRENIGAYHRDACRFEVYVLDGPYALVHAYERGGDGKRRRDPATGRIVVAEPVIVPVADLPPAHLLRESS
jgi:hypothetical protein